MTEIIVIVATLLLALLASTIISVATSQLTGVQITETGKDYDNTSDPF